MKSKDRAPILVAALAIHALGFAAVDSSMVQMKAREILARSQPERIVVTGPSAAKRTVATQSCAAPRG